MHYTRVNNLSGRKLAEVAEWKKGQDQTHVTEEETKREIQGEIIIITIRVTTTESGPGWGSASVLHHHFLVNLRSEICTNQNRVPFIPLADNRTKAEQACTQNCSGAGTSTRNPLTFMKTPGLHVSY